MNIKQRRLPSAYQEVEWIQNTGQSYIDTGVVAQVGIKSEVDISYQLLDIGDQFMFAGQGAYIGVRGKRFNVGGIDYDMLELDTKYHMCMEITSSSIIGTLDNLTYINERSFANYRLFLFGISYNGIYVGDFANYAKLYNCNIYNNDVLIQQLVPCYRISDSVIGMYDTIGGTFYTNQGSGTFTKGADVVTVDAISIPQGDVRRIEDSNGIVLFNKPLITFDEMATALLSAGCVWTTDEYGDCVYIDASTVNEKTLIEKTFKPNTNYEIYILGYNGNSSYVGASNMNYQYTNGDRTSIIANGKMIPTKLQLTSSGRTLRGIYGEWFTSGFCLHDFYLKEI